MEKGREGRDRRMGWSERVDSKRSGDKHGVGGGSRRRQNWVENWEGREIEMRGA